MGILSGLDSLGLGNLSSADLYEEAPVKPVVEKKEEPEQKKRELRYASEQDFVFGKTYTCPVCDQEFKNPTMRSNKARMIGTDMDLRPRYYQVDPIKYDVVCCPICGFAALTRYSDQLTYPQARLIRENISKNFQGLEVKEVLSYDDAIVRYQLALANAMVKRARASEKAYICLKMAWLVRGKMDSFDFDPSSQNGGIYSAEEDEKELLKNALDGFLNARQNERPPICGMDNGTVDYLVAALAYECGEIETSAKMVGLVLQSNSVNKRTKDMARDLKEKVVELLRKSYYSQSI
ncbi:MAG: DUF2225 domain-containing protein [Lachnospiraceae bacterium]|nr:DUF2225 domain-containing protein [Lachnospiraceae bacterium]